MKGQVKMQHKYYNLLCRAVSDQRFVTLFETKHLTLSKVKKYDAETFV